MSSHSRKLFCRHTSSPPPIQLLSFFRQALKSIVRKDTGADWQSYLRTLAQAEGIKNPTAADLQRLDRGRPDKKVSNEHWASPSDPQARIARMKDGTTHLERLHQ